MVIKLSYGDRVVINSLAIGDDFNFDVNVLAIPQHLNSGFFDNPTILLYSHNGTSVISHIACSSQTTNNPVKSVGDMLPLILQSYLIANGKAKR